MTVRTSGTDRGQRFYTVTEKVGVREEVRIVKPDIPGMDVEAEVTLTNAERRAILRVLHETKPTEDVVGQLMCLGAFHELPLTEEGGEILRLAWKLEGLDPDVEREKLRVWRESRKNSP